MALAKEFLDKYDECKSILDCATCRAEIAQEIKEGLEPKILEFVGLKNMPDALSVAILYWWQQFWEKWEAQQCR